MELTIIMSIAGMTLGLMGWMYKSLLTRLTTVERETMQKSSIRELISDKLAPVKVDYLHLREKLDELHTTQRDIDRKLDEVINLWHKSIHRK